ncbi:NAD(P)H-binding protein [Kribbella sp. NBC_01245]|uniref:SDR family oxidoreductase n=1 Tax=Kribbella sp. NBC_01245 TaxID=2903578 RepID=UPI002E29B81D|nr:NAD(P)H-binding protein [Kribbella sp. NBC_01245]
MTSTILVTGGTGTLGRRVTPLLLDAGFKVRLLSRSSHQSGDGIEYVTGDLLKGEGVDAAVDGAEIVLHLAGGPKGDDVATRNLAEAAARAGVRHLVYISVIGADRVPLAWLKSKLDAEKAIAESGVPWTTLRAAQFNELTFTMVEKMAKLPVTPAPGGLRLQPVDSRDVAARLVELVQGEPAGLVPDLAGPKVYGMVELVQGVLAAQGKRNRPKLPVRIPGKAGKAYRAGDNLTLDAPKGAHTWESFLADRQN